MADFKSEVAPHKCVQCGSPAYIPFGDMACKCTQTGCIRFDKGLYEERAAERREQARADIDEYIKEHAPDFCDEDTEPDPGAALRAQADLDASFDWENHVLNSTPVSTNGNEMTFQLPKRKARSAYIGDRLGPAPGWRICKIDRVTDQITLFPEMGFPRWLHTPLDGPVEFSIKHYYGLKMGSR